MPSSRPRYEIDWMLPSECADRLAAGTADIGLVPIASLATTPGLRILPGCTIASKGPRALAAAGAPRQPAARTLCAPWPPTRPAAPPLPTRAFSFTSGATRTCLSCPWLPISTPCSTAPTPPSSSAIPALLALEERANRFERTGEELVYHDLAEEWRALTGLPFVSAVWGVRSRQHSWTRASPRTLSSSRDHGLQNIDALVAEWSRKLPLPAKTILTYLTTNIHYVLDEECVEGMRGFFRMAAETGVLPEYRFSVGE